MPGIALPIDPLVPQVLAALQKGNALVLEAPPGAGKTTRIPRALLETRLVQDQEVWVLQPRRLPARLAAERVAEEMGEEVGQTVGYQMRFENKGGPKTRLRFVTEGILTRRLLSEPELPGVGAVVLDEFHERHLHGDLGLALLSQLQQDRRPELKLVVMSATLQAAPISQYLRNCPTLRSEGRRFEVSLEYLAAPDERPLETQVLAALKRLAQAGADGDILVFLPGASEIKRAKSACEDFANSRGWEVHALHGELPPEEQNRAIRPSPRLKVILSTNVAESSVTLPAVTAVVDSGLARVPSFSPWSGLPALKLSKISKASAIQRLGRAGRTRAGRCLRLYTRGDYDQRAERESPEIQRADLCEAVLTLKAHRVHEVASFPFLEAPPQASLRSAETLLARLGALDPSGITALGRHMLQLPLHPRLARVMIEGEGRGVAREAATCAALISERDIRREARAAFSKGAKPEGAIVTGNSDVLDLLDRFQEAERGRFSADKLRALDLDPTAVQAVRRAQKQLSSLLTRAGSIRPRDPRDKEEALLICLLTGYSDRVARRRKAHGLDLVLSGGGGAQLSAQSVVHRAELMLAVDVEERGGGRGTVVRLASAVEPEWLLGLYPAEIHETDELQWSSEKKQVERLTRLSFGDLVLEETRTLASPSEECSQMLAEAVWSALSSGNLHLGEPEELNAWRARMEIAAKALPQAAFPAGDPPSMRQVVQELCAGMRSFDELAQTSLVRMLASRLSPEQTAALARIAPERISLPGGRVVNVQYELGRPPWIESRLQDFFGMGETPCIGQGKIPLVLHLLAPNQRAVQVTSDLSGFWERHYPSVRRELMRKYPRHFWPDDPRHAQPRAPTARRR